jgi:predicted  nucleic acid-binding Zn-ribbon protein
MMSPKEWAGFKNKEAYGMYISLKTEIDNEIIKLKGQIEALKWKVEKLEYKIQDYETTLKGAP